MLFPIKPSCLWSLPQHRWTARVSPRVAVGTAVTGRGCLTQRSHHHGVVQPLFSCSNLPACNLGVLREFCYIYVDHSLVRFILQLLWQRKCCKYNQSKANICLLQEPRKLSPEDTTTPSLRSHQCRSVGLVITALWSFWLKSCL